MHSAADSETEEEDKGIVLPMSTGGHLRSFGSSEAKQRRVVWPFESLPAWSHAKKKKQKT